MRVLVTGASGMLGREVATALRDRGEEVTTFQRRGAGLAGTREVRGSVIDPAAVAEAVAGQDAVVHLAAKVSLAGTEAQFEATNVVGTRVLLAAARDAGARRFVFISSPSVAHTGGAIVGAAAERAEPTRAGSAYTRTKAAAELLALGEDAPGFAVVVIRPHIVWGPGDTQLVQRIADRAAAGRLPRIGSGAALIDTTYIDNAVRAIVAGLDRAEAAHGEAYVVTNGEPRPVFEIIAAICRAAGVAPPRRTVPGWLARAAGAAVESLWAVRPGEDEPPMTRFLAEQLSTAHWFDQRRTRSALGWAPTVSLDEGFARLAEHYARRG